MTDRPLSMDADRINGSGAQAILFGPFRLLAAKRLLLSGENPVRLGSRALDMLIALVERPGELVSKEELMARVWPNTFVEPGNVTVHIAALRRALGDGCNGNRYLINIPGRGYRFVAPITLAEDGQPSVRVASAAKREHNLPALLTKPIGRADIIDELANQVAQRRLLTIAGPGGIGKTTVALALAEHFIGAYEQGIWLIDLADLIEPHLAPGVLAAVLGLEVPSEHPLSALIAALKDKHMLLVFDNCEHVIAATAGLVAGILRGAPNVQILATSREPLRVEGEHVFRLPPLAIPPASCSITASEALEFSAVQLFVERATAALGAFELSDSEAPFVAGICRGLDGLALAIELAAARVDTLGVRGVAAALNDCLQLLTRGCRTALPRQQSLAATLDWSHALLDEAEQTVFRRLAVFARGFTLCAAGAIAADEFYNESETIDLVATLIAKSLVVADGRFVEPRFRLLDTTRAFALVKLAESGELETLQRRHAEYCENKLEPAIARKAAKGG